MTSEKLFNNIHSKKGYGRVLLENIIKSAIIEIAEQLSKGQEVKIDGFGTFRLSTTKAHKLSFNSNILVPERITVIFSPEEQLKEYVNGEITEFSLKKTQQYKTLTTRL